MRPTPRGRSREDRVAENWSIEVPERFYVDLTTNAATVEVDGIAGGVSVRQGYGRVRVAVPRGDLDLQVQVGDIDARSSARDWRQVSLRSQVGSTRIWVDDRKMKLSKPPGPGNSVRLEGRGDDVISLRVRVGDAELHFHE